MRTPESPIKEDIPSLAREAFALADSRCGPCSDFHALWPYIRLARASGAAEGAQAAVQSLLVGLFAQGARRLLIAGAADTGLLSLVARAGADWRVEATVLDRCDTPLELCRRFARRHSLSIRTVQKDLKAFDVESEFDIIFAHSLLQFIEPNKRVHVLTRLHRSLHPQGRLVMVFRAGRRIEGALLPEYRAGYADWVLDELERLNIFLPAPRDAFRARLQAYGQARETREGALGDPAEVDDMLESTGFAIESRTTVGTDLSAAMQRFTSKLQKQRYLTLAKPKPRI